MSEHNLSHHILPTSAQLVGVCLTVISLIKALHIGQIGSLLDKLLAIDALLFTISASLSYFSMREAQSVYWEKYADQFFMVGLLELGGCAILLSFEII
ncbi:MAG: hypothetical protein WC825_08200 [Gallionellaceae bacterium]|jgi:hypothetical protein